MALSFDPRFPKHIYDINNTVQKRQELMKFLVFNINCLKFTKKNLSRKINFKDIALKDNMVTGLSQKDSSNDALVKIYFVQMNPLNYLTSFENDVYKKYSLGDRISDFQNMNIFKSEMIDKKPLTRHSRIEWHPYSKKPIICYMNDTIILNTWSSFESFLEDGIMDSLPISYGVVKSFHNISISKFRDSSLLAAIDEKGGVYVTDFNTLQPYKIKSHGNKVYERQQIVEWNQGTPNLLACTSDGNQIQLYDIRAKKPCHTLKKFSSENINFMKFGFYLDKYIITISEDGEVNIYDIISNKIINSKMLPIRKFPCFGVETYWTNSKDVYIFIPMERMINFVQINLPHMFVQLQNLSCENIYPYTVLRFNDSSGELYGFYENKIVIHHPL